jgi:hypothetical protein
VPLEQLIIAQGILTSNKDADTDRCTKPALEERKGWSVGKLIQWGNPHTIAFLCNLALDLSINLTRTLQRQSHGIMTKATAKPMAGVKKMKGLSVIEDRAYALATYTATHLFALDYVKRTKSSYHDRWPTNDQIREWKARAAHAWKYSTKAQQELWDMSA